MLDCSVDEIRYGACNVLETMIQLISQYGYYALYPAMALGMIGFPLPEETLLTFVGSMTVFGAMDYFITMIICFLGTMTGMITSYSIGKKFGKPFLYKMGKWVKLTPARLVRTEQWFQKYGIWSVSFGYFVPGVRQLTSYMAGFSGVSLGKYILFAGSGALVWVATFVSLGRFVGFKFHSIVYLFHEYLWESVFILSLSAAFGTWYYYYLRKKR